MTDSRFTLSGWDEGREIHEGGNIIYTNIYIHTHTHTHTHTYIARVYIHIHTHM